MNLLNQVTPSQAPNAVLLIRLMVGAVFLSEGIQKFLFPADVGAGRFAKIGLLIVGAGAWSLDARLRRKAEEKKSAATAPSPA